MADPLADDWSRPTPDARDLRRDAFVAVLLAVGAATSVALYSASGVYDEPAPWWASTLYVVFTTLPLAFRRRMPGVVAVIVSVAYIASMLAHVPDLFFGNITLFTAIYSLGAWGRNRRASTLLRGAIIAGMLLWLFLDLGIRFANPELLLEYSPQSSVQSAVAIAIINVFVNLLYFGAAYVFGERAWTSARERAALQARTAELAEERERSARQAVVLERLRIARELHDVVAHHVSVMGVQAGAARRVLPSAPERAVEALSAVEESARRAVDDLQRMLGTLRSDGQEEESAPSTLGVDGIPALVEEARKAGRTATLSAFGEPRDVGGTVGNTLYRVAQEAITNSIKHAAPTSALDVRLRWLPGTVELEVSDTGGRPVTPARGAGLGLVGMRERLNAVGGTLDSGPRREGGYLVRAAVPTDEPAGVLPATGSGGPAAAETPADAVRVGAAR